MMLFIRTFFMVLLMELGSASNFTLAATASHTGRMLPVWLGGIVAMGFTCFIAVKAGNFMNRLPISPDLISGIIMTVMGLFFLWRCK